MIKRHAKRINPVNFWKKLRRLEREKLRIVMTLCLLAGILWAFAELSDEVLEQETRALDESILLAMRRPENLSDPVGPKWVEELGRDFTALGGIGILTTVTLAVIGFFLLLKRFRTAFFVFFAVGGGMLLSSMLKMGFERPRPDLVPHDSYVYTASFPSGHSMMAAVTYFTLAAMLAQVQKSRAIRYYFFLLSAALVVAVGISRVYLGVHWPTDVLAGWMGGLFWALFCRLAAFWLQLRGRIEVQEEMTEP